MGGCGAGGGWWQVWGLLAGLWGDGGYGVTAVMGAPPAPPHRTRSISDPSAPPYLRVTFDPPAPPRPPRSAAASQRPPSPPPPPNTLRGAARTALGPPLGRDPRGGLRGGRDRSGRGPEELWVLRGPRGRRRGSSSPFVAAPGAAPRPPRAPHLRGAPPSVRASDAPHSAPPLSADWWASLEVPPSASPRWFAFSAGGGDKRDASAAYWRAAAPERYRWSELRRSLGADWSPSTLRRTNQRRVERGGVAVLRPLVAGGAVGGADGTAPTGGAGRGGRSG